MFSIGEFSKLAKTTVRTLRFYDEIGLFKPSFVQKNGYRFYSINDLTKISQIIEFRSIGLSLSEIQQILGGEGATAQILKEKFDFIKQEIENNQKSLLLINKMLNQIERSNIMKNYEAKEILLPEIKVFYRHGTIENMSKIIEFIMGAGEECGKNNPNLKCKDYCFVTYEAPEYQEENVELEYAQEVFELGQESENIKFKVVPETKAITVIHYGTYSTLRDAYAFALNFVKEKKYQISNKIREVYVHGCWDTEKEEDFITEIQIPVK